MITGNREKLRAIIYDNPGMTTRELADAVGMTSREAVAELVNLASKCIIIERWDGDVSRWFTPG